MVKKSVLLEISLCISIQRLLTGNTKHKIINIILFDASLIFLDTFPFRYKMLCTWDDFMSGLHVIPTPGIKLAQIKFNLHKFCTIALLVIYENFLSIFEPLNR